MSAGSDQGAAPTTAPVILASAAPPGPAIAGVPGGLLDAALAVAPTAAARGTARLDAFLASDSPAAALRVWLQWLAEEGGLPSSRQALLGHLGRTIAQLDQLLSRQVNAILHHPRFQQLEASWRGLRYLAEQAQDAENVKVRVLSVGRKELARDFDRAIEFDQSTLFRKVYEGEFGMPGGEPFGVLLGDYQFSHHEEDVHLLDQLSGVAAAAFAPFLAAASPAIFGLDQMTDLERPLNLPRTFEQLEYLKWRALRAKEDARFVGLVLPRVLMRRPYEQHEAGRHGFRFREESESPSRQECLWGNAVYAFGAVLARTFGEEGWLANIHGVRRDEESRGVVSGLPPHPFSTDLYGVAPRPSTEVMITDEQEQQLSELGFISLCHCPDTPLAAFYTTHSIQKPKTYDDPAATINARVSAVLQYLFCASRFAHYLKVITRDKIGSFSSHEECEDYLHRWLHRYVVSDSEAGPEIKAEYPLREARVRVQPCPGKPGAYLCTAHLWPHFELDALSATIRVTTELARGTIA